MVTAGHDEMNRVDSFEPHEPADWQVILTTGAMNNWSAYQISTLTASDGLSMKNTEKICISRSIVVMEQLTGRSEPEKRMNENAVTRRGNTYRPKVVPRYRSCPTMRTRHSSGCQPKMRYIPICIKTRTS